MSINDWFNHANQLKHHTNEYNEKSLKFPCKGAKLTSHPNMLSSFICWEIKEILCYIKLELYCLDDKLITKIKYNNIFVGSWKIFL